MSEKEKKIAETFKRVIPNLPEEKKEYLLGMAEGMSIMADRQRPGKNSVAQDAG